MVIWGCVGMCVIREVMMDFGIEGKIVFVCVVSKGFGCGCVEVLVVEGVNFVIVVCMCDMLEEIVEEIWVGVNVLVMVVVCDIMMLDGCVVVFVVCL